MPAQLLRYPSTLMRTASSWRPSSTHLLAIVIFVCFFRLGSPFLYDHGTSGRYLALVQQQADPLLFPNDHVIDSLKEYRSAFYLALGKFYRLCQFPAESLPGLMNLLYTLSRVALVIVIYLLAQQLGKSIWLFLLMAPWLAFQTPHLPLSGAEMAFPVLRHNEVQFLLGIIALILALRKSYITMWIILCAALFVHPLPTFHLILVAVPPILLLDKDALKSTALGALLFAGSCVMYFQFFAPPSLTPAESQALVEIKRSSVHVSLFDQGWKGWVQFGGIAGLALLSYLRLCRWDKNARLVAGWLLSGTCFAFLLSLAAVFSTSPHLVLFQPMRIFFWVMLVVYVLLARTTAQSIAEPSTATIVLLTFLLLTIINSIWALAISYVGIALFLSWNSRLWGRNLALHQDLAFATVFLSALAGVIMLAWFWGDHLTLESFKDGIPVVVSCALIPAALLLSRKRSLFPAAVVVLMMFCLCSAAVSRHRDYAKNRAYNDPDWNTVQYWCRDNTDKTATLITPPAKPNFRTRALRTTLSEDASYVVWVDPGSASKNQMYVNSLRATKTHNRWNLAEMFALARAWKVSYVIVEGPYSNAEHLPVFRCGRYSLFEVPATEPGSIARH